MTLNIFQLRDMEHIMHARQGWRQLQSVCHNYKSSQDRKQTDVTGASFPLIPNLFTPRVGET
jgi:hypothetical protein